MKELEAIWDLARDCREKETMWLARAKDEDYSGGDSTHMRAKASIFGQQADKIESLLPALEKAFADQTEIAALRARCEQTDVQLAGCATAAQGWAKEPPQPGDYGWSASFQEVLNLRQKWESACEHERLAIDNADGSLPTAPR